MQWSRDRRINSGVMQPVSRQRIGKHDPVATNTHATIELLLETVFSIRSLQRGYKEDSWGDPVSWQLSSARETEKRWRYSSVVVYSPDSNDVSTEAGESPLLRAVTKQRLVKTLKKTYRVVICKLWRSVVAL
jgi:hypothetical protein